MVLVMYGWKYYGMVCLGDPFELRPCEVYSAISSNWGEKERFLALVSGHGAFAHEAPLSLRLCYIG